MPAWKLHPTKSVVGSSLKQVILLIPLTLILPRFMGIKGVLAASPIADGIILLVLIILVGKELKDINQLEKEKESKLENV